MLALASVLSNFLLNWQPLSKCVVHSLCFRPKVVAPSLQQNVVVDVDNSEFVSKKIDSGGLDDETTKRMNFRRSRAKLETLLNVFLPLGVHQQN